MSVRHNACVSLHLLLSCNIQWLTQLMISPLSYVSLDQVVSAEQSRDTSITSETPEVASGHHCAWCLGLYVGQDEPTPTCPAVSSYSSQHAVNRPGQFVDVFRHTALNCHQCGCLHLTERRSWSTKL